MSSKPEPSLNLLHPLPSGGVMQFSGPDALAFAQAQFANDITFLADGTWQWNLWLSPKGRVIALFLALRLDTQNLLLWLPDHPAEELAQRLLRFRFRSKLEIAALPNAAILGAFCTPAALGVRAQGQCAGIHFDGKGNWNQIDLDLSAGTSRSLRLIREPSSQTSIDPEFTRRWLLDDIAHGLPHLDRGHVEAFTPQMLGLGRLQAFSVKKGCYPGQEIVARTHFLGQAKRQRARLQLDPARKLPVEPQTTALGRIEPICSVCTDDRSEALVVAPLLTIGTQIQLQEAEMTATVLPLLDGPGRDRHQAAR